MTDKQLKFPKSSLLVLAAGLIAVSIIAFISLSQILTPNTGVNDIDQARDVIENYSWNKYLKDLSSLYEELVHGKRLHKGL